MKRKFGRMVALVLAIALMLSVTAVAANDPVFEGTVEGATLTFTDDCTKLNVSYTNSVIQDGQYYMVWMVTPTVVEGTTYYTPTDGTIEYIGQGTASGTTFTFEEVYPYSMGNAAVMISGPGLKAIDTADGVQDGLYTLGYVKMPYLLGDANEDTFIDASDALLILQYKAGTNGATLTATGMLAADVNVDHFIDATDALAILQYKAGTIDSLPPDET